jgi:hypothetical protein
VVPIPTLPLAVILSFSLVRIELSLEAPFLPTLIEKYSVPQTPVENPPTKSTALLGPKSAGKLANVGKKE